MNIVKNSILYYLLYSVVLGIIYPAVTILTGSVFLESQAKGSLIFKNDSAVGSIYIGQNFTQDKYFWGRPSSTTPTVYNPASSVGSNLSLTNPALQKSIKERADALGGTDADIPVDLVTSSGSGLDPEISPASAKFQVKRIAKARKIDEARIHELINRNTKNKVFGLFGESRLNVLQVNIELDML